MKNLENVPKSEQTKALTLSTLAFTVCFAVWTIFSIIGIKIKGELGLSDTQFGLLVATPILTGSLSRIFLGIWTDQYGGRIIFTLQMLTSALAAFFLTYAHTYPMYLVGALGLGLSGGSFAVGIAYVSSWYEDEKQGTALGIFGAGNVGAAITNFGAPILLVAMGGEWRKVVLVYASILAITAVLFFLFSKTDPAHTGEKGKARPFMEQMKPLKHLIVWRFALYYFFVFGGYVALALWLPRYYVGAYHLPLATAGMLAAAYALPGAIFRALGGWLSDKFGARTIMYWTFTVTLICAVIMSYPSTDYVVKGIEGPISFNLTIPLWLFVTMTIILGFFMSLGKAAVYKHIPHYFPENVGSVGGIVGLIGGLGGFILPITFGIMNDHIGVWTSCFMLLSVIISVSLIWMHFAIRRAERKAHPELRNAQHLPELDHIN